MSRPSSSLSTEQWKARIEPHLSSSLRTASEKITQTDVVQSWLQNASIEAADGLGQMAGTQGQMQGYMKMMNALEEQLPNLVTAVHELTEGWGEVDLHWRPLQPNFSRVYVTFDLDYSVSLYTRLSDCTPEAARSVLATVSEALPDGQPFPNRPKSTTGFVTYDGRGMGVRVHEQLDKEGTGTYQTVTLLPPRQSSTDGLSMTEAANQLLTELCPTGAK